jgi:hypothetical protein
MGARVVGICSRNQIVSSAGKSAYRKVERTAW